MEICFTVVVQVVQFYYAVLAGDKDMVRQQLSLQRVHTGPQRIASNECRLVR